MAFSSSGLPYLEPILFVLTFTNMCYHTSLSSQLHEKNPLSMDSYSWYDTLDKYSSYFWYALWLTWKWYALWLCFFKLVLFLNAIRPERVGDILHFTVAIAVFTLVEIYLGFLCLLLYNIIINVCRGES